MELLGNSKIYQMKTATTGVQVSTSIQGDVVLDTKGFDNVMYIMSFSANLNSTGGQCTLSHQHSDSTTLASMVTAGGSTDFQISSSACVNGKTLVLDVHRSEKRYCTFYLSEDTTNHVSVEALGILYNPERGPTVQPSSTYGVLASNFVLTPTS